MNSHKEVSNRKFNGRKVRFSNFVIRKDADKKTGVGNYNEPLKLNKKYTSSFVYWRVF